MSKTNFNFSLIIKISNCISTLQVTCYWLSSEVFEWIRRTSDAHGTGNISEGKRMPISQGIIVFEGNFFFFFYNLKYVLQRDSKWAINPLKLSGGNDLGFPFQRILHLR